MSHDYVRYDDEFIDRRVFQRDDSKLTHLQYPFLDGPTGVPWQIHSGYSESAKLLLPRHRETAFIASYVKGNFSYCRYLGLHVDESWRNKHKEQWYAVLKKTKRGPIAGMDNLVMIGVCAQFLTYLGDLHVQIVRCLENGVILKGIVNDLRSADLDLFTKYLDDQKVPQTNEQNPYRALGMHANADVRIHRRWLQQEDAQIERLHSELGIESCGR